jgi:hypothetical protein
MMGRGLRGWSTKPPTPTPEPGTVDGTRYYFDAFIATLKDCGHKPEHVRAVLREYVATVDGVALLASIVRIAEDDGYDRDDRLQQIVDLIQNGTPPTAGASTSNERAEPQPAGVDAALTLREIELLREIRLHAKFDLNEGWQRDARNLLLGLERHYTAVLSSAIAAPKGDSRG